MGDPEASSGTITSVDGTRTISVEEFDRIADDGSDEIDEFIDWSKAYRVGSRPDTGRLNVELSSDQIRRLHAEADRRGIPREALLAEWVGERLQALADPACHQSAAE